MNTIAKLPADLPPEGDDLSDLIGSAPRTAQIAKVPENYRPITERIQESCRKCGGSGSWRPGYPCFACKGSGKLTFKTSPEKRAAGRTSAANSKARKIEAFKTEHPDVWAWMDGSTFQPAVEMRAKLEKYGSLFDSSIEFARRMIARRDEAKAAAQAEHDKRISQAAPVNADALAAAFGKASGKKAPKLYIGDIKIYPAKDGSKWAGSLYLRDQAQGIYLGRITAGSFVRSRECSEERGAEIVEIMADPKAAAIKSGKLTLQCAVCRRTLSDPESVAAGIGPICAAGFGW